MVSWASVWLGGGCDGFWLFSCFLGSMVLVLGCPPPVFLSCWFSGVGFSGGLVSQGFPRAPGSPGLVWYSCIIGFRLGSPWVVGRVWVWGWLVAY